MEDTWQPLTPMAAPFQNVNSVEKRRNGTGSSACGSETSSSAVTVETHFKGLSARNLKESLKERTLGTFRSNSSEKYKIGTADRTPEGDYGDGDRKTASRNATSTSRSTATSSPNWEIVQEPPPPPPSRQRKANLTNENVKVNLLSERAKNLTSELSKNLTSDHVNYLCNEQSRSHRQTKFFCNEHSRNISREQTSEPVQGSNRPSANNSPSPSQTNSKPTFLQKVQKCVWFRSQDDQNVEDPSKNSHHHHHCKEISITQWIYLRIRRLFFLTKKKDPEFEDIELAPLRYRPVRLDQLCKATKFTKEELQFMYRGFKQECPTGVISEETFKSVYGKFFPICGLPDDGSGRNTPMYAHYVFGTMDQEGTGQITFGEFIMGLSVLLKGSLQERVNWVFNLYDINNDGYITKEELVDIVTSIYDLMGDDTHPNIDDIAAVEHVEKLFDKLDLNRDGVVTIDEFMEYCTKNEDVISSMNCFNKA